MQTSSLLKDIQYKEDRPAVQVLLDSDAGKEIRIVFKEGQEMKRHQAPFPIVVEIFEGNIIFGVEDQKLDLKRGDMITLKAKVPHDLKALDDSIVRLSLNTADSAGRVNTVTED